MPTIRDLVSALRRRDGVDAAVVLGRDGLVIDGQASPTLDVEHVAAHVPGIAAAAEALGEAAGRGALASVVLEHDGGISLLAALTPDVLLLVVLRGDADVAPLLYELRRSRTQLAALV
jgi:predicted regulator of Ras-like GTPase activity (Roadblock/LC7/MglB family)